MNMNMNMNMNVNINSNINSNLHFFCGDTRRARLPRAGALIKRHTLAACPQRLALPACLALTRRSSSAMRLCAGVKLLTCGGPSAEPVAAGVPGPWPSASGSARLLGESSGRRLCGGPGPAGRLWSALSVAAAAAAPVGSAGRAFLFRLRQLAGLALKALASAAAWGFGAAGGANAPGKLFLFLPRLGSSSFHPVGVR